jgi:predicted nucleic acid-binding Zn ribbon protein
MSVEQVAKHASPSQSTPSTDRRPSGRRPSLISEITVEHGPHDILGPFFLRANTAARERGITLSLGTFEELVATNVANTSSWHPLIPLFDPKYGPLPADKAFCILGTNDEGEVVATQAARLYQWPSTSFHYEAESLRLFHADPARTKRPTERCVVTAESAKFVSGNVVFSGGGWYRRDYRKLELSTILPRISRALAFTRWNSDYTVSIMAEKVIKGGMAERCGYTNVDWDLSLFDSPVGTVRCAFVWMERVQLLQDLSDFLARFDAGAQVDRRVDERRA